MFKAMKKIFSMLMMLATMALFTACGSDDDSGSGGSGNTGGAYVGEWVNVTSYDDNDFYVDAIKLNSNGTGTETTYHLSEYESIYEAIDFTYSVSGNQVTVKSSKGTYIYNYTIGSTSGYRSLTLTINGKTRTYLEMTPEIRNEIDAFHPVPGDVH